MGWLDDIAAQQKREWEARFKGPWYWWWQILSNGRIYSDGSIELLQPAAALRQAGMSFRYTQPTIYRYIWLPAGFVTGSPARWALDRRRTDDLLSMKPFYYPGPTGAIVSA